MRALKGSSAAADKIAQGERARGFLMLVARFMALALSLCVRKGATTY